MVDRSLLAKIWLVSTEESTSDTIVLRPSNYAFAPSRRARRAIDLTESGAAFGRGYGANDAYERQGGGSWTLKEDQLNLDLDYWQGTYTIEQINDEVLILKKH